MAEVDSIQGLDAALAATRAEGHAAGRAEGYSAGRVDAAAILNSEAAAGCMAFAAELAGDPSISVARAGSLIERVPKAAAPTTNFAAMMQGKVPDVGANAPAVDANAAKTARIAQLNAAGAAANNRVK